MSEIVSRRFTERNIAMLLDEPLQIKDHAIVLPSEISHLLHDRDAYMIFVLSAICFRKHLLIRACSRELLPPSCVLTTRSIAFLR
eukprot:5677006-Amphidinium_carterae.2